MLQYWFEEFKEVTTKYGKRERLLSMVDTCILSRMWLPPTDNSFAIRAMSFTWSTTLEYSCMVRILNFLSTICMRVLESPPYLISKSLKSFSVILHSLNKGIKSPTYY